MLIYVSKIMQTIGVTFGLAAASLTASAQVYELRTYTVNDGKLEVLNERFRDHTVALFEKHGIESVGYWIPMDEPEAKNTLICLLKHESRIAARRSFEGFVNDPDWKKVKDKSESNGPILAEPPKTVFMELTDYSRGLTESAIGDGVVFELRTYTLLDGKRTLIDARSRDHAIRLFSRHGMQSVGFWHPIDQPDSADTFIYMLQHENRETAIKNWRSFAFDPEWRTIKKESEKDGPFIAKSPDSIFLVATDYSSIR